MTTEDQSRRSPQVRTAARPLAPSAAGREGYVINFRACRVEPLESARGAAFEPLV